VPGGVAAGAMDEHPRRHLVLVLERPHLAVVLFATPVALFFAIFCRRLVPARKGWSGDE
jgi:hypothetical protein